MRPAQWNVWVLGALCALSAGCMSVPPPAARPDPAALARQLQARRLDLALPGAPPAASGWDRGQWLDAALRLNPDLAEARARATATAAAERTAHQRPNPTLNLFGEYIAAAAGGVGWLYGLSLDFLLQRPGERARAQEAAALETQAAESDVAEAIWSVRMELRAALLEAVFAEEQAQDLERLLADRQGLVASARARADAGEISAVEVSRASIELGLAQQRREQALTRAIVARTRLAAAVGLPVSALQDIPLRWSGWSDIATLAPELTAEARTEALVARPDLVRTLREYDLAENALRSEVARRWPAVHVEPGFAWDKGGVRENQLNETLHDNQIGLSLEVPLFNRNEGPIGESVARRDLAGRHLEAVQADLLGQIDQAQQAWPRARDAWRSAGALAEAAARQSELEQRALASGASDRSSALSAEGAAIEARLIARESAYDAQQAFGALENAYRRPLEGPERDLPQRWRLD